jgi:hypothetical protein
MKKVLYIVCAVFLIGVFSSCRTHERCPAYGKIAQEKAEKSV